MFGRIVSLVCALALGACAAPSLTPAQLMPGSFPNVEVAPGNARAFEARAVTGLSEFYVMGALVENPAYLDALRQALRLRGLAPPANETAPNKIDTTVTLFKPTGGFSGNGHTVTMRYAITTPQGETLVREITTDDVEKNPVGPVEAILFQGASAGANASLQRMFNTLAQALRSNIREFVTALAAFPEGFEKK